MRTTATRSLRAEGGTDFANKAMAGARRRERATLSTRRSTVGSGRDGKDPLAHATRDFLPVPGKVLANLRPNEDGVVELARRDLGPGACDEVTLLVVDRHSCSAVEAVLGCRQVPRAGFYQDRRLETAISADRHVVETKRMTLLQTGQATTMSRGDMKAFDSLSSVAQLLEALARGKGGKEWALLPVLLQWGTLSDRAKRTEYERFASHELHLFTYHHDRPFFDACVRPHLETKVQPTVVDDWLLGRDLGHYVADPSRFAALNAAEKALLVARLPAEQGRRVAAHLRGVANSLSGVDTELDRAFDTAIKLSAMEAGEMPPPVQQWEAEEAEGAVPPPPPPLGVEGANLRSMMPPGGAAPASSQLFSFGADRAPKLKKMTQMKGGSGRNRRRVASRRDVSEEEEDTDDTEDESSPESDAGAAASPSDSDAESLQSSSGDEWQAAQLAMGPSNASGRRGYQPMDKTQEWMESNYLRQEKCPPSHVPVSGVWADLAEVRPMPVHRARSSALTAVAYRPSLPSTTSLGMRPRLCFSPEASSWRRLRLPRWR